MIPTLIFLLGAAPDAPIVFGAVDDAMTVSGARRLASADDLSAAAPDAAAAARVVAVLRGEDVAVRVLPWSGPASSARARAAAASLFEDELAEPVDGLHIAVEAWRGALRAVALRKTVLERWTAAFAAAGVRLDAVVVDFLALPESEGTGFVLARDGRVAVGIDGRGFAAETSLLGGQALPGILKDEVRFAVVADAAEWRAIPFKHQADLVGVADDAAVLALFARGSATDGQVNLLQGAFRPKISWTKLAGPWRRAGLFAAAAAALGLLAVVGEGARDLRAAERWKTAAAAVHARAFEGVPASEAVANARARLAQGGGRSFAAVTTAVAAAAGGDGKVQIDRIRYEARDGAYFVSVKSVADADIEAFKTRLGAAGLPSADSGGYRRLGEVWTGEIVVRTK